MEEAMKAIDKACSSASVNSEHLFALGSAAIGYAACFDTALAMTAQRMKKVITSSTTSAKLAIGRIGDRGYVLGIDLYVEVRGLPKVTHTNWLKPPTASARTRTRCAAMPTSACTLPWLDLDMVPRVCEARRWSAEKALQP